MTGDLITHGLLFGDVGIVDANDDAEHQHRVRVKIPAIDPDVVYPRWIKQLLGFIWGRGYGSYGVPAVGTEVALFGRIDGELYYAPVYNENNLVAGDFNSEVEPGWRFPADLKVIAQGNLFFYAGGSIVIETKFGTIEFSAASGLNLDAKPKGELGA